MRLIAVTLLLLILCLGAGLFSSIDKQIEKNSQTGLSSNQSLPDFKLIDIDGREVNSHDAIGPGSRLIVFVNPGCAHCETQVSELLKLAKSPPVAVIADLENDSEYERKKIAASYGSRFELFFDRFGERKNRLGVEVVPYTVLVDQDKYVRMTFQGEREAGFLANALNDLSNRSEVER